MNKIIEYLVQEIRTSTGRVDGLTKELLEAEQNIVEIRQRISKEQGEIKEFQRVKDMLERIQK